MLIITNNKMLKAEISTISANIAAVLKDFIERVRKIPSPLSAPVHSDITAPITAYAAAILSPEKKYTNAVGNFNFMNICSLLAFIHLSNSSRSLSYEFSPSVKFSATGKKTTRTQITNFDVIYSNHMVTTGAIAIRHCFGKNHKGIEDTANDFYTAHYHRKQTASIIPNMKLKSFRYCCP